MPHGSCTCAAGILGQSVAIVRSNSGTDMYAPYSATSCAECRRARRSHRLHAPSIAVSSAVRVAPRPAQCRLWLASFVVGSAAQDAGGMARWP